MLLSLLLRIRYYGRLFTLFGFRVTFQKSPFSYSRCLHLSVERVCFTWFLSVTNNISDTYPFTVRISRVPFTCQ